MAEFRREMPPTRAALVELKEERELVKGGYDFLDEKRLLLAAEMLRMLSLFEALSARLREAQAAASDALAEAIARHGLDGLQVYPPPPYGVLRLAITQRTFLGVNLQDARLEHTSVHEAGVLPVFPSPEASQCAEAFYKLLELGAELAGLFGNLQRMIAEYRRTQRRAKALEDVILPEIEVSITDMESRLEEIEQEDAIRVRLNERRAQIRASEQETR